MTQQGFGQVAIGETDALRMYGIPSNTQQAWPNSSASNYNIQQISPNEVRDHDSLERTDSQIYPGNRDAMSREEMNRKFLDMRSSYSEKVATKSGYTKYPRRPTFPVTTVPKELPTQQQTYSLLQSKNPAFTGSQRRTYVPQGSTIGSGSMYKSSSNVDISRNEDLNNMSDDDMLDNQVYREYGSTSSLEVQAPNHVMVHTKHSGRHHKNANDAVDGKLSNGHLLISQKKVSTEKPPVVKDKTIVVPRPTKNKDVKERPKSHVIDGKGSSGFLHKLFSSKPDVGAADAEELLRLKAFVHFDCQSVSFSVSGLPGPAAGDRNSIAADPASNSSTGASAIKSDGDAGDGISNSLVQSCANFRNEIGHSKSGSMSEWMVGSSPLIARKNTDSDSSSIQGNEALAVYHQLCHSVSVLEFPADYAGVEWHPLGFVSINGFIVEHIDRGATYYRQYFHGRDHQNFFGTINHLGAVAVSLRREKIVPSYRETPTGKRDNVNSVCFQYRIIVRTKQLTTLRGCILEDVIPSSNRLSSNKGLPVRDVLEYAVPELDVHCLRHAVQGKKVEDELVKLDEQKLSYSYKFGVLYCRQGQTTEEDMYNNEHGSSAFHDFLLLLGNKIRLQGFDKYKGGLDTSSDTTGTHSVFWQHDKFEIMYHVSTMLPYSATNKQQILRKCHIGNDIVTIVFQEPGSQPFSAKTFVSNFQHVFIIVRPQLVNNNEAKYSIAVMRAKGVSSFGPPIFDNQLFDSTQLAKFLPIKAINAENAVHLSEKFATMAMKTREAMLRDLALNSTTSAVVDNSSRMGKFSFGSGRKKTKQDARTAPDLYAPGGVVWQMEVENVTQASFVACLLVISHDLIVVKHEATGHVLLVTTCQSVVGWTIIEDSKLRIYFNDGEYFTLRTLHTQVDEISEVVSRLRIVTYGTMTQEISIARNGSGQLGFQVTADRVVVEVETGGKAWLAGLRSGCRLLEVCRAAIITLSQKELADKLKLAPVVVLVVVPPHSNGLARSVDGILRVVCGGRRVVVSKSPLPTMWPSESAPSGLAALATQDYTDSGDMQHRRYPSGDVLLTADSDTPRYQPTTDNTTRRNSGNMDYGSMDKPLTVKMTDYKRQDNVPTWQRTMREPGDALTTPRGGDAGDGGLDSGGGRTMVMGRSTSDHLSEQLQSDVTRKRSQTVHAMPASLQNAPAQYLPTSMPQAQGRPEILFAANYSSWDNLAANRAASALSSSDSAKSDSAYHAKSNPHLAMSVRPYDSNADNFQPSYPYSGVSNSAADSLNSRPALSRPSTVGQNSIGPLSEKDILNDRQFVPKPTNEVQWGLHADSNSNAPPLHERVVSYPHSVHEHTLSGSSSSGSNVLRSSGPSTDSGNSGQRPSTAKSASNTLSSGGSLKNDGSALSTNDLSQPLTNNQTSNIPLDNRGGGGGSRYPTYDNSAARKAGTAAVAMGGGGEAKPVQPQKEPTARPWVQPAKSDNNARLYLATGTSRAPVKSTGGPQKTVSASSVKQQFTSLPQSSYPPKTTDKSVVSAVKKDPAESLLKIVQKKTEDSNKVGGGGGGGLTRVRSDESLCGTVTGDTALRPDSQYPTSTALMGDRTFPPRVSSPKIKRGDTVSQQRSVPLVTSDSIEWSQLVDVATKSLSSSTPKLQDPLSASSRLAASADGRAPPKPARLSPSTSSSQASAGKSSSSSNAHLEAQVSQLQHLLAKEQSEKQRLEREVVDLQDENSRLRADLQQATDKLKQFSDWAFNAPPGYI